MANETVTILCSGVALGVYVPPLIVSYQLRCKGITTDVAVIESLIFTEKRKRIPETKTAFHRNFKIALTGLKLLKDIVPSLDPSLVSDLLETWDKENRMRFIIFSGLWLPVIERYMQDKDSQGLSIDLCYMDSGVSPSWKLYNRKVPCYRHIWFTNWEKRTIFFHLKVSSDKPIPYDMRDERFVVHGGGWGMGTYKKRIPTLGKHGFKLNVITYEKLDLANREKENRYFMIDNEWNPWEKNNDGCHQFPPFGEIRYDGTIKFRNNPAYHDQYDLTRQCKAIISKPGGATLLDSISSATPIILLEPYGEHEEKNARLWEYLGFGIPYEDWMHSGYSLKVLKELHTNLCRVRENTIDFVEWYYANHKSY